MDSVPNFFLYTQNLVPCVRACAPKQKFPVLGFCWHGRVKENRGGGGFVPIGWWSGTGVAVRGRP
jgi:hypothetical protein